MLRITVRFVFAALVGWLLWQLTSGYPVNVRLVFLGAYVLGSIQSALHRWAARGETGRRARKS